MPDVKRVVVTPFLQVVDFDFCSDYADLQSEITALPRE
jgi:hypothetical protein